tara:strand:+ start:119614 stop:120201 length:588 start_codon:yes stop_codon:yes gene_type:complete
MSENTEIKRYNSVAITLHWVMAIGFFMMLGSGLTMSYVEGLEQALKFNLYQWHKSGGVILLIAALLRIIWRFIGQAPKLPETFPRYERIASKLGHFGLYAMMIIMPVSGWFIVSSSSYGLPTIVFNLFEWPHIPNLQGNKPIHEGAEWVHFIGMIAFLILIAAHIGAVIKHFVFDKENILTRMWWVKEKDIANEK